jgi:hypothetical protein
VTKKTNYFDLQLECFDYVLFVFWQLNIVGLKIAFVVIATHEFVKVVFVDA